MAPVFLEIDDILEMHRYLVERYGGSQGVRDMGLLESAVAMPAAGFGDEYLHKDLFEMAAAYLFHIVGNHPFVDGNKRTGAAAAGLFLERNGISCDVDEQSFEDMVLAVARGEADKAAAADFFRKHLASPLALQR